MANRDDFSEATKRALAERAAYFCSSPRCRKLTIGPHTDPSKALKTGCAAHIHAAAVGGPRYDENQTPEQRRDISNGLWLCRECGQIVDSDVASHQAEDLRAWKATHEAMIAEVRTKGYSDSLALLEAKRLEPAVARKLVVAFEDHRALWAAFDAENPVRVQQSLDRLRSHIVNLRGEVPADSPMDLVLNSLRKTILAFFDQVQHIDLNQLHCYYKNPQWIQFRDALAALRKAVGLQLGNLISAYAMPVDEQLRQILPENEA